MKHSAVPATALLALSVGAVLARAAPGGGSQAGWLRHAVRAEGPAITAAPERLASTPESPLRVRDDSPNVHVLRGSLASLICRSRFWL